MARPFKAGDRLHDHAGPFAEIMTKVAQAMASFHAIEKERSEIREQAANYRSKAEELRALKQHVKSLQADLGEEMDGEYDEEDFEDESAED